MRYPTRRYTHWAKQYLKAYNLGWKLLACLQWNATPSILSTYETERRPVAQELLDFDQGYAQSRSRTHSLADARSFQDLEERHLANMVFTTGAFDPILSKSCGKILGQNLGAKSCGRSEHLLPSNRDEIVKGPDCRQRAHDWHANYQLHGAESGGCGSNPDLQAAQGRRSISVVAFPRRHFRPKALPPIESLGRQLSSTSSFVRRLTPSDAPIDLMIEILTIHAAKRAQVELLELPDILHPWSEEFGRDWCKVYVHDVDVHRTASNAYQKCQVDPAIGCLTIIRPDSYVALVCGLEELDAVDAYFTELFPAFH